MKKSVVLTLLLAFLVVMNAILLFLIFKKDDRKPLPPRDFIAKSLDFNEAQLVKFKAFNKAHHNTMRAVDEKLHNAKQYLFKNALNSDFPQQKIDSVTNTIGQLSEERESEVFSYFKQLKSICNNEQKAELENIVSKALRKPLPPPPPR